MFLQSRRPQSDVSAPFWILWVVCQHCCFDCVQILRLVLPYRTFTLFQGLTSASRKRSLQQLHQHRPMSTSVHRLPLFQKWSRDSNPFAGSLSFVIIWSARFFVCIINMNASRFTRFLRTLLVPGKDISPNRFASKSASSAQSFSSTASVSGSFPILRSTGVFLCIPGHIGNWSSCRSCSIDHHSSIHQLALLMFNH